MTDDIRWEDELPKGTEKYPAMLKDIKKAQLANPDRRESWGYLNEFASEQTARDLAWRLGKTHVEFEFMSRKAEATTAVYCRLKEGINA